MARLVVFDEFIEELGRVRSERIAQNIEGMLLTIEQMPGVGSSILTPSVVREFGSNVRKAVVSPYEIIYEYDQPSNTLLVYGLRYGPAVT